MNLKEIRSLMSHIRKYELNCRADGIKYADVKHLLDKLDKIKDIVESLVTYDEAGIKYLECKHCLREIPELLEILKELEE